MIAAIVDDLPDRTLLAVYRDGVGLVLETGRGREDRVSPDRRTAALALGQSDDLGGQSGLLERRLGLATGNSCASQRQGQEDRSYFHFSAPMRDLLLKRLLLAYPVLKRAYLLGVGLAGAVVVGDGGGNVLSGNGGRISDSGGVGNDAECGGIVEHPEAARQ